MNNLSGFIPCLVLLLAGTLAPCCAGAQVPGEPCVGCHKELTVKYLKSSMRNTSGRTAADKVRSTLPAAVSLSAGASYELVEEMGNIRFSYKSPGAPAGGSPGS